MGTEVVSYEAKALAEYKITPAEVAAKAQEYIALNVIPDDAQSYKAARTALTACVSTRTSADKRRKELKEDALKWGKAVDQAYKDLIAPLAPVEAHLQKELNLEDGRKAEVRAEKVRIEQERVSGIKAKIEKIRSNILLIQGKTTQDLNVILDNVSTIVIDDAYQEFQNEARVALDSVKDALDKAIIERIAFEAKEAAQKEEAARLAKQREEQEAIHKAQEAEAKRLDDLRKAEEEKARKEREAIEAEKRKAQEAADRAEFERKAKEKAEAEAREKVAREAKEKADKEEAERLEAERKAALAPDKSKLLVFADALVKIEIPFLTSEQAKVIYARAIGDIVNIRQRVLAQAEEL